MFIPSYEMLIRNVSAKFLVTYSYEMFTPSYEMYLQIRNVNADCASHVLLERSAKVQLTPEIRSIATRS